MYSKTTLTLAMIVRAVRWLSHRVYELNVRMLRLLEDETISRSAPRVSPTAISRPTGYPRLEIGNQGSDVRRLQRALRRAGQDVGVDGLFRQKTWEAVCSLQRSRGLKRRRHRRTRYLG